MARRVLKWIVRTAVAAYLLAALVLLTLRFVEPPTTAVQIERRVESWFNRTPYHKVYEPVPLSQIAPNLPHAVIAAEDARFYQHHGFDWKQIETAAEEGAENGKPRGASTITQQLVKNLFLSTGRSYVRKGIEFSLVPLAELILGKQRILELYLNVIEWGPGVYGAQAAAERWDGEPASRLTREQSIQLAALLPAPRRRKPGHQTAYCERIALHMRQMGW